MLWWSDSAYKDTGRRLNGKQFQVDITLRSAQYNDIINVHHYLILLYPRALVYIISITSRPGHSICTQCVRTFDKPCWSAYLSAYSSTIRNISAHRRPADRCPKPKRVYVHHSGLFFSLNHSTTYTRHFGPCCYVRWRV